MRQKNDAGKIKSYFLNNFSNITPLSTSYSTVLVHGAMEVIYFR